jgi:glutaryl-CoA dehydrogenase
METKTNDIGRSRSTDYFLIGEQLTDSEREFLRRTRRFVDDDVLPVINEYWEAAEFPFELVRRMAELGIVGDGLEGYGCPPMSPIASGLIHMELHRGDASVGTFHGVHSGLAMQSIAMLGSDDQKQRWLPGLARLETVGAFALTEPDHGSDAVALETTARRHGTDWILDGDKRWIGNGTIADVVVVWARDVADGRVKGFLVERNTPGYEATVIGGKVALRSVWNADIELRGCRVPEANRLAHAASFADTARVLAGTRNAVAWASLGHAVAAYEIALSYATERRQFGKPLVSFQLIQQKLVTMLAEVTAMQLYCLRLGRLIEEGRLTDTIAALAKLNNTVKARDVCRMGREILGGNGILLDHHVVRHLADMEALYTYEGTAEIQTLIVGRDITGVGAFT